ncbi:MAG: hypothetical protein J0M16_05115 [Gammaproteobacteria bacterium]|nr:hypothetical protein [Gammaproteobacteria bacterium]
MCPTPVAVPALFLVALAFIAPAAVAAGADVCQRELEGVSVTMDFDAAKAAWTARGYQDVSPAQLARGYPTTSSS